jgi:ATP-dependent DNA ligase
MRNLPVLFIKSNTGAIQQWETWVSEDNGVGVLHTQYGHVGGKLQHLTEEIREGKNAGKANATDAYSQAVKEAKARWTKQKKGGYVESMEAAQNGEVDTSVVLGGIAPMLAHPIEKVKEKNLKWPALVGAKLDGLRCIATRINGEVSLWSRKRERIMGVPHIEKAVLRATEHVEGDVILDGELFCKEVSFQEINGFVRTKKDPKPGHEVVQYWVYDVASVPGDMKVRYDFLANLMYSTHVKRVESVLVETIEEAWEHHARLVAEGYEGAIVRQFGYNYEQDKRSNQLLKLKSFDDSEFIISDVREGRGKFAGTAIYVCETNGKTFDCAAPGTIEERKAAWENRASAIGQKLTVKYFGLTDDNLPRFPVSLRIRID